MSSSISAPTIRQSITPNPTQTLPRIRGGFEVDDDGDNDDEKEDPDDGDDDNDVYDPAAGLEIDVSTPVPDVDTPLDRNSQSPEPDNADTSAQVPTAETSTLPSSSTAFTGVSTPQIPPTSVATATAVDGQLTNASPRSHVNGTSVPAIPKSRLAHDVVGILEDRIKDDPRGDTAAYFELIEEFKNRNKQDEVRRVFNQYLDVFPMAAEQWCSFVRWEEQHDRKFEMEKIFNRALLEVLDVELWSIYISYIRRRHNMQVGDVARSYKIINDAFTFALKTVGMDKDSGKMWQDYVDFLKTGPGVVGGSNWQDGAKVDALREAYQKAIAVPTGALTGLWKEYDAFETGLSKINGRKYLQEKSPSYMTARTAYTQLQNQTRNLKRSSRPVLPPAAGFQGDAEYLEQVSLWQQWIQWEKEDNLVLIDEDLALYNGRVLFTYKQALMALQFWPEMWYDAAEFCFANDLESEGTKFLTQGITANPESPLLALKMADRLETSTQNDESTDPGAKIRMKKVREPYDRVLDALYDMAKKVGVREQQDVQKVEMEAELAASTEGEINAATVVANRTITDAQINAVRQAAQAQIQLLSKVISHMWVALMRATRRIQGKGLPTDRGPSGFRAIFGEARKRGKLTPELYVEAAQIEWQCYRDPTGTKILERGLKLFPEDDYLPLQYIKHLININDITNARSVFETTTSRLLGHNDPTYAAKTKPLFAYLHDYESKYGDLSQVQKLEERMRKHFPEDSQLTIFSDRYRTSIFDPVNALPIVSPQQTRPKTMMLPSIEVDEGAQSPIQKVIDSITFNSPKRAMPEEFEEIQPRKLARGESPLKGAAGRRINQQQQLQQRMANGQSGAQFAASNPLPPQITYLLSIIPKASLYTDARFDAVKMVELLRDVRLPSSIPGQPSHLPQPPQSHVSPSWPAYQPSNMLPQAYGAPTGISQNQYGGAPFRFA